MHGPDASAGGERASAPPDPRDALKRDDGFVATFLSAPLANRILRRIEGAAVTPNQVTVASLATAILAAVCFAAGSHTALVFGALLLQVSFVLDCLDGQLARHRGTSTAFGAWLDGIGDRMKEVILFAGIAVGLYGAGGGLAVFAWSYAALLVVLYRSFDSLILQQLLGAEYRSILAEPLRARNDPVKADDIETVRRRAKARWGRFGRLLDRAAPKGTQETRPAVYWLKRFLLLDFGERHLLISVLAAAGKPEWIFPVIVVWGGIVYPLITVRRWMLFGPGRT